jgi:aldose 1-epimerase
MKVSQRPFGDEAFLFTMENDNGVMLEVTNFGARIINLFVPTDSGHKNIILGFDSIEDYKKESYCGATIGRVAGRIKNGEFRIDESRYQTSINQSGNTLHGGYSGLDLKYWSYEVNEMDQGISIIFSTELPDGEDGFPGSIKINVTYTLDNNNVWSVSYKAISDKDTIFNPTNHVYFNLTGHPSNPINDHSLQISADEFAPVNEDTTVTGEKYSVIGTSFDFRTPKKLKTIFDSDDQIAARLISPDEKLTIEVYTEEPAIVVYTANVMDDVPPLMHGEQLVQHGGITFETQAAPGAIEFEGFGDIVLRANSTYTSQTKFKIRY